MAETAQEIKPWNPDEAVQALKERIRLEYIALIPADRFAQLIASEVQQFMGNSTSGYYSDQRAHRESFSGTVNKILRERVEEECKKVLTEMTTSGWNNTLEISAQVKAIIAEKGNEIVTSVLQNIIQNTVNMMVRH